MWSPLIVALRQRCASFPPSLSPTHIAKEFLISFLISYGDLLQYPKHSIRFDTVISQKGQQEQCLSCHSFPYNKIRLALFGYSLATGNYTAEASLSAREYSIRTKKI
jgi:hypothetical protein